MFKPCILFYTDGYKIGHKRMLAKGTVRLYGTWIPRSVKYAPGGIKKIVSFGQQLTMRWLHDNFKETFFDMPVEAALEFAEDMCLYLGMDFDGNHFVELHQLGYLPVRVKSLPEGIETNPNVPHMTFINTVDGFAWLTLFLETLLSALAWKPSTSATISKQYNRNTTKWVMQTDPGRAFLIPFLNHDFSARGLDPFTMYASGLGHATSSMGSDTLVVIPAARYFYNEPKGQVAVYSVNASEHSVSTTKIFTVGEQQMIADWIKDFPKGILSIVADTFDLWHLINKLLPANKEGIMRRGEYLLKVDIDDFKKGEELIPALDENNKSFYYSKTTGIEYTTEYVDALLNNGHIDYTPGKLVIRPDSGDPVDIVCGVQMAPECAGMTYDEYVAKGGVVSENEWKGVIQLLWEIFGGYTNEQGYRCLDAHIGAIYGDSITLDRQVEIYERLAKNTFATTNIVLGIGSYTYQCVTRDTLGFAAKGAWFEVLEKNALGEMTRVCYDIYKDPVTDTGKTKKSLKGLIMVDENLEVHTQCTWEQEAQGILQVIYENGIFYNQTTLTEVRRKLSLLN